MDAQQRTDDDRLRDRWPIVKQRMIEKLKELIRQNEALGTDWYTARSVTLYKKLVVVKNADSLQDISHFWLWRNGTLQNIVIEEIRNQRKMDQDTVLFQNLKRFDWSRYRTND